jgi:sugar/nucleoside kinase (ribokinase family)
VSIFLSEEETAGWANGELEALAAACERVVITRGEEGATELTAAGVADIPPAPGASAHTVDSVGAGDTFAAAFMAVRELRPRADPGRLAAEVAAAAVALQHGSLNPAFGAAAALAAARSEPRRALLQSALIALRRASTRWLAVVTGDSRVEL